MLPKASLRTFLSGIPQRLRHRLVMHFTSLEQPDEPPSQVKEATVPSWARPQELVRWMAWAAKRNAVRLKGENALSWDRSNLDRWERLRTNLAQGYEGVTLLRLESFKDALVLDALRRFSSSLSSSTTPQELHP